MTFQSDGSYTRYGGVNKWKGDAASPDPRIKSDVHDDHDNDLANALSDCFNRRGLGGALENLSMGGHRLMNLGEPDPGSPQDAATKHYVDTMTGWPTHKDISGTDLEGRLNFTGLTGVNGITWSNINGAWVAKKANADRAHERDRVTLSNLVNPGPTSAGDVVAIDIADGKMNFPVTGQFDTTHNLILDPDGNWRTPVAGTGSLWRRAVNTMQAWANSVVTTVPYGVVTGLFKWYELAGGGGISQIFNKKASGDYIGIYGQMGGNSRWLIVLGDTAAETGSNAGSNFALHAYGDGGAYVGQSIQCYRATAKINFPAGYTGAFNTDGTINYVGAGILSAATTMVIAATGNTVYLRPNGAGSGTGAMSVATDGTLTATGEVTVLSGAGISQGIGLKGRTGAGGGGYQGNRCNMAFSGTYPMIYVNDNGYTITGIACDHRIKQEVKPLESTWAKVKAMRPVSYRHNGVGGFAADGLERWGFLAHELQESLLQTAATGSHDAEEDVYETSYSEEGEDDDRRLVEHTKVVGKRPQIQAPDLIAVVAALTAALQEAQLRIEALEARP